MSDSGPKTGLRQALGTADLDPDDEVHYLAMLLGEAKRYDGAWDGDPEGAARWAVALWCQEIGYVPTLAEFDAGEQVGKAETPPNCEAAFRSVGARAVSSRSFGRSSKPSTQSTMRSWYWLKTPAKRPRYIDKSYTDSPRRPSTFAFNRKWSMRRSLSLRSRIA